MARNGAGEISPRPFVLRFGLDSRNIVARRQEHTAVAAAVPRVGLYNLFIAFHPFYTFAHARLPINQSTDFRGYRQSTSLGTILCRIIARSIKNSNTHIRVFAQTISKGVGLGRHGGNIPHHGRRTAHGMYVGYVHLYRDLVFAGVGNRGVKFNFIYGYVIAGEVRRHGSAEGKIPIGFTKFARNIVRTVPRGAESNFLIRSRSIVIKNNKLTIFIRAISILISNRTIRRTNQTATHLVAQTVS